MAPKGNQSSAPGGMQVPASSYEVHTGQVWGGSVSVECIDPPETPREGGLIDIEQGTSLDCSPERLLKQTSNPDKDNGSEITPVWHLTDVADLLGSGGAYDDMPKAPRSPSILSAHSFAHRHRNLAIWVRIALVLLLAGSVMGTALFVLRLYNATMYHEADKLGLGLLYQLATVAHMQMDDFVNEMARGTQVLSGNLHGQGLVPLLADNIYHPLGRKLLWETFKSVPYAEMAAYATPYGSVQYLRLDGDPTPYLVQGRPVNLSQPLGPWMGAIASVDPDDGTWTVPEPQVPVVPMTSVTQLPIFHQGLIQPRGTVAWWTGLLPGQDFEESMVYAATTPLSISNATAGGGGGAANASSAALPSPSVIGVVGMTKSTLSLQSLLVTMEASVRGGRLFFSLVQGGTLVMANKGRLSREVPGPAGSKKNTTVTITAEMSDDPVIAAAARHLRVAFPVVGGYEKWEKTEVAGNGTEEEEEMQLAAALAGLCWISYDALILVGGQRWYLHCEGRIYGGSKGKLPMVGVMLFPRDSIMGQVDHTKHRTLAIVVGVALSIAVLGVGGVYLSTVAIKQMAKDTRVLESAVEKQEGEMEKMAKELDNMRALLPAGVSGRQSMDMRTPMETINDLLAELARDNKVPTAETLAMIQTLLKMPEPHMPIVLQEALVDRSGTFASEPSALVQALGGVPPAMLDDDLSSWLRSTVMRLPRQSSIPSRTLSRMGSVAFYRRSDPDEPIPGSPLMRTVSGSVIGGEEVTLDSIIDVMRQVVQHGRPEEEMSLKDYGTYPKFRISASMRLPTLPDDDAPPGTPQVFPQFLHRPPAVVVPHHGGGGGGRLAPAYPAMQSIRASLEGIGRWNFDTMDLAVASSGQPILWMGLELYRRAGCLKVFHLPLDKLTRFLILLDEGMPSNCYHNSTHIADVANSLYHLIRHSGVGSYLMRLDVLAAITAALVHDFRHPGLNNDFVVRSSDDLALRYNDRTVLENYHVAEAFILLANAELNFLDVLDKEDFKYVRNVVIELVLGSDLKRHFELVELFKKRIKDKEAPLSRENEADRLLLMQIALKVADIGHSAKMLGIHKKWTVAITEEFYLQGDKEKARGFKVSPFMDRENNDLPKSQLGFFSFIALPLYEAWVSQFPDSNPVLDEMMANIKYWEGLRDKQHAA